MKILVINGSPKGKSSITFQTMLYLGQKFPDNQYRVIHAGARIKGYENDFEPARQLIEQADLLVFTYPVYTFLVPSQLHRFIELMKEETLAGNINLEGKLCTQISTSKHFYDMTAHAFIEDNCRDLGMEVLRGLSADMEDLTTDLGRYQAEQFFEHLLWTINDKDKTTAADISKNLKEVVVVADLAGDDKRLKKLVDEFVGKTDNQAKVVNIHDFKFRGGCVSCFNCSSDGECIYTDGFQELLRNEIQGGSAIVLAFTIKDHSMGSLFKTYDDRQFCNGHRTVTKGMPFAYLISGELSKEVNLRTVIEARSQVGGNYIAGIATDEEDVCKSVDNLAKELSWCIEHKYEQPSNFYGVGGMKIFRDLIWQMQGMMKADYRFFKENGQMDFPQKQPGKMLMMYAVGAVMDNKKIKNKLAGRINEGMLMPYKESMKKGIREK